MKLLLDTHVLFWWSSEPAKLSNRARSTIEDASNQILVSAVVAWELAIKSALGKLEALALVLELSRYLFEEGFEELPITLPQACRAGLLPWHHRDPFDRLLVAQAQDLSLPIISSDRRLDRYGIRRLW